MANVLFVAVVSGSQADGYHAQFPDLPECRAEGRDLSELLVNARQALAGRLEALELAEEPWPVATPIEQVALAAGAIAIPVDVSVDDTPIRINISLGERLVQRLDAAAELRGMTRSGFIAQSVRISLGETAPSGADFDAAGRRLQEDLTALGRKINDSIGPDSPFSRRMAEFDDFVADRVRRAADSVSAAMSRRQPSAPAKDPPAASEA